MRQYARRCETCPAAAALSIHRAADANITESVAAGPAAPVPAAAASAAAHIVVSGILVVGGHGRSGGGRRCFTAQHVEWRVHGGTEMTGEHLQTEAKIFVLVKKII